MKTIKEVQDMIREYESDTGMTAAEADADAERVTAGIDRTMVEALRRRAEDEDLAGIIATCNAALDGDREALLDCWRITASLEDDKRA